MACRITGCELYILAEGKWAHGDLHTAGSAMVFNAVLNERGETAWEYGEAEPTRKIVELNGNFPYFERRGVIVFDKFNYSLNEVALRYLGIAGE